MKISFYDPDEDPTPKPKKRSVRKRMKRQKNSSFTLDWIAELGWEANPFELKHYPISDMISERQEINLFFVKRRRFGLIKGDVGMGKSTLLRWLDAELRPLKKEFTVHYIEVHQGLTDEHFLIDLADPFRGMFSKGKPISSVDLFKFLDKVKGHYVLLIDNANQLAPSQLAIVEGILERDNTTAVCTSSENLKIKAKDELCIKIKKPSIEGYERILAHRIELVGGQGIKPFTKRAVRAMAEDTSTVASFLRLAQETAINIALKHTVLEEEPTEDLEEELVFQEEQRAEGKKVTKKAATKASGSAKKKSSKKQQYDELIESLTEGM